ncbi:hypothetical protein QFC22_004281 [Naganishia vaughanmartiniae]|uniref:Uncharacterized protein n=1 Tax=Naganishia vaughanmartiniae TaxID=1424756 RepID=A0ACC2X312_9TREE|nr:hypothetical protein QFC22_004281 [Naganishia vaughanmartiniae]
MTDENHNNTPSSDPSAFVRRGIPPLRRGFPARGAMLAGRGGRGGRMNPVASWNYSGDEREPGLVEYLEAKQSTVRGDPDAVLDAIWEYKQQVGHLMIVGKSKGLGVEKLIRERKPKLILELGAYVGYSAVYFAKLLPEMYPNGIYPSEWNAENAGNEDRVGYISIEKMDNFAEIAEKVVDLAGLGEVVKIINGSSTPVLKSLRKTLNMPAPTTLDMIFIDHHKPLYTNDLKVLEDEGLIGKVPRAALLSILKILIAWYAQGTCIVADNVVMPGNPAYLSYIRATPQAKRQSASKGILDNPPASFHPNCSTKEEWQSSFRDGPLEETRWVPPDSEGVRGKGNPELVYEGWMLDDVHEAGGWDACEVSICQGEVGDGA